MKIARITLCAAALLATSFPVLSKEKVDRARAEAERACYLDAKTLCPDAIPDESKVAACFKAKRPQLSSACRTIFDRGI